MVNHDHQDLKRIRAPILDLSPDLDRLEERLIGRGDDVMMLSEPDGFLTAILVCCQMLVPSIWLPYVWGPEGPDREAGFEWTDQAQDVALPVMGHYNPIARSQRHPSGRCTPIGRNHPCPCGSGKKYKKCCAVN